MLVNTSRGAVVDTRAVIGGLKSGRIGYVGLDVYEKEADLFFHDLSEEIIQDEVFARLRTFPNVVITAHQAFFTREALASIAETKLRNISDVECGSTRPADLITGEPAAEASGRGMSDEQRHILTIPELLLAASQRRRCVSFCAPK